MTFTCRPPHLKDLEALEPAFYNSLLWIQENDPEPLDLTFTVEEVSPMYMYRGDSPYPRCKKIQVVALSIYQLHFARVFLIW